MDIITPEKAGLSSKRLQRIRTAMQRYIDRQQVAGIITLLARHGQVVHFECVGSMDIAAGRPMRHDTLFRIFSMSKPIASVAVLMLYEEGHFHLSDPISRFIPEFKDVKVFVGKSDAGLVLADLEREITIHNLLTHTAGLTYGFDSGTPVDELYRKAKILGMGETLADKIKHLVALPLVHQPSEGWTYSVATDVLGRLVELVAGVSFDVFLKERIFEPLGMVDTDFYVPADKLDRLSGLYEPVAGGGVAPMKSIAVTEDGEQDWLSKGVPPKFLSGGGGLVSSTHDYFRFAQMLLNKGSLDGVRLLGRKTVELMTMNHLPIDMHPFEDPSQGFGLGVGVLTDLAKARMLGSVGTYGWGGAANTDCWIDPQEDMVGLLMLQFMPSDLYPVKDDFKIAAYQALVE